MLIVTGCSKRFIPAYAGNSAELVGVKISHTVHPRLRGELRGFSFNFLLLAGSSPLTRGTPDNLTVGDMGVRFIPAYAGNSPFQSRCRRETPVHPRLRGELLFKRSNGILKDGSSPLTRGTRAKHDTGPNNQGFIPAYAGNSSVSLTISRSQTVHPRLRGELT